MNARSKSQLRRIARLVSASPLLLLGVAPLTSLGGRALAEETARPSTIQVTLTEWKVALEPKEVPPGPVVFEVSNPGKVPHSFEIEGQGVQKSTARLLPGGHATLKVDLADGSYEAYCPVGKGSHRMMGMTAKLKVEAEDEDYGKDGGKGTSSGDHASMDHASMDHVMTAHEGDAPRITRMRIVGGGPVIQILPGPFPFADSAMAVVRTRSQAEQADLLKKAQAGPYSNRVAAVAGKISILATDHGASGDSVSGTAEFTSQDGARWKLVMDRVQTRDIPFNPRFGGVIMGLYYHGASNLHTPLVPTIQSSVALWSIAHLYRNGTLATDSAMVHVMLLSRTRRPGDWALDCWDCSERPVEELQLQVTSAPGTPAIDAPGGFLFVNWEKSSGTTAL